MACTIERDPDTIGQSRGVPFRSGADEAGGVSRRGQTRAGSVQIPLGRRRCADASCRYQERPAVGPSSSKDAKVSTKWS